MRLAAVGDVDLARSAGKLIEKEGPAAPWREWSAFLSSADISFANLECVISTIGQAAPKRFTFRAPTQAAAGIAAAGLDVLSLANNHALDFGSEALSDTVRRLQEKGLRAVGAGPGSAAADPVFISCNGVTVAFLAASDFPGSVASSTTWTVSRLGHRLLPARIRAARQRADAVVVSLHWGVELSSVPTGAQRRWARRLARSGADLILGHGPHVLQGEERIGKALVAYSLGNFVFQGTGADTRDSAVLEVSLSTAGVIAWRWHPAVASFRPRRPAPAGARRILEKIRLRSRLLSAAISPVSSPP